MLINHKHDVGNKGTASRNPSRRGGNIVTKPGADVRPMSHLHLQLCCATLSHDKVARENCTCDMGLSRRLQGRDGASVVCDRSSNRYG